MSYQWKQLCLKEPACVSNIDIIYNTNPKISLSFIRFTPIIRAQCVAKFCARHKYDILLELL